MAAPAVGSKDAVDPGGLAVDLMVRVPTVSSGDAADAFSQRAPRAAAPAVSMAE
jgi:hypothetical protein